MNRLRAITTKLNKDRIPLRTQQNLQEVKPEMVSSAIRRKHLNIVTQDVIEQYLQKGDLDMNDENDSEVFHFCLTPSPHKKI